MKNLQVITQGESIRKVKGKAFNFRCHGMKLALFIHKDLSGRQWAVSEITSGQCIARADNRQDCKRIARDTIRQVGKAECIATIKQGRTRKESVIKG